MKIIIIEDDHFFQNFYSVKLNELGYQVEVANNGQEGIDKIKVLLPNLILLDLIMPVKDGFQVLAELKNDPLLSKIPVIVFSTLGQESDIKKAIELGAKDYINKSFFDFDVFIKRVVTYLPQIK
ncbi:MAG: PAS domain S-box [Candidatus Roizmanbacteria bacterium GW2011_GWA2_32_13]|uniref:PAS domain S-box n=1 Tax=Candidatus Roizmanbacteria bacterium GW2011_GWA2_32_13 TaxID=1618475 RepID=A0A0G0BF52_9BACT|nr:MAG: PAS domain S-box [Candidatus Roizmanbacteria bacterium GW2011_GWA2_32_13]